MDNKYYDSTQDTLKHIDTVYNYLLFFTKIIMSKARKHDKSKLEEPEKSIFDEFTPKLKNSTYGSDEYKSYLSDMQEALDHHYSNNPHHPERFKNGIEDMTLMDIVEMFFDWMAAVKRHDNGDINKSIEINKNRFGYGSIIESILKNTARCINDNWFYEIIEQQFIDSDNKNVRSIVYDWFTGIGVNNKDYESNYTKDELKRAHDVILTLVSCGLG
jgi:hypothetical protein